MSIILIAATLFTGVAIGFIGAFMAWCASADKRVDMPKEEHVLTSETHLHHMEMRDFYLD
jgi:hypothetical protein